MALETIGNQTDLKATIFGFQLTVIGVAIEPLWPFAVIGVAISLASFIIE